MPTKPKTGVKLCARCNLPLNADQGRGFMYHPECRKEQKAQYIRNANRDYASRQRLEKLAIAQEVVMPDAGLPLNSLQFRNVVETGMDAPRCIKEDCFAVVTCKGSTAYRLKLEFGVEEDDRVIAWVTRFKGQWGFVEGETWTLITPEIWTGAAYKKPKAAPSVWGVIWEG